MRNKQALSWLAGAVLAMAGAPTSAMMISVSNTDASYDLVDGVGAGATYISDAVLVADPKPWGVANGADYFWIAPSADQRFADPYVSGGEPEGMYFYQTTFDLTGLDPDTAVLAGSWAGDNAGEIFLNGVGTGNVLPLTNGGQDAFNQFNAFSITDGFVAGVNTLTFKITNADATGESWAGNDGENPTGVIAQFTRAEASAVSVPEPTALLLFGAGLIGLGLARRKGH
jgi:hypothetical protein